MPWDRTICQCRLSKTSPKMSGWFPCGGGKTPCPPPAKPGCPPAKPAATPAPCKPAAPPEPCKKETKPASCKKSTLPRASNPFLVFFLEMLGNCPGRLVTQVAKAAGKQWCSMDWEKRQPYVERALAERRRLKRSCKRKRKRKSGCKRKPKHSCKRKPQRSCKSKRKCPKRC